LIWPFARYNNGYGNVTFYDALGKHSTGAHRIMCKLVHGEPPTPKHEAAHSCGNGTGGCINPHHLRSDTRGGNNADKKDRIYRDHRHTGHFWRVLRAGGRGFPPLETGRSFALRRVASAFACLG
jgi:hypothetical protein